MTGGSRGLGKEMATLFADNGAKVVALDLGELSYKHENVSYKKLDVSNSKECEKVYQEIMEE
ncbi:MAG: SDR family NAD(P)-dependent oxidoreductase, partial [Lachnospirales bacterium]